MPATAAEAAAPPAAAAAAAAAAEVSGSTGDGVGSSTKPVSRRSAPNRSPATAKVIP